MPLTPPFADFGSEPVPAFAGPRLPLTPEDVLARVPVLARRLAKWDPAEALARLAGLQLEPRFHANYIRLAWATRLIASLAQGTQVPQRADLMRLVNVDLDRAEVNCMEDPCEDFFLAPIATTLGEIPIFMGTFSHSAFYLDCLLDAFQRIADEQDRDLLASLAALLRVSAETASRAGLARRVAGEGLRAAALALPPETRLRSLADCARWPRAALAAAGIAPADLAPFVFAQSDRETALASKHGNGPADFRPFFADGDGIVLASPSNISTAARAAIVDHALATGRERPLAELLLAVQAERLSESRFVRTDHLPTAWRGGEAVRSDLLEYSAGRLIHAEQIVGRFAGWREFGFAAPAPPDQVAAARLTAAMRSAQKAAQTHAGFYLGATLYLMGGWGPGQALDIVRPSDLRRWGFLAIEVADAIALSGCEQGTLGDLWRIDALRNAVAASGYELQDMSGPLNLFQWWRNTEGSLVPQHEQNMHPPMSLVVPTDGIFTARQEGIEAHDRRSVALPSGQHTPVIRVEPQPGFGTLDPIYVSCPEIRRRELLGVTLAGRVPCWLYVPRPAADCDLEHAYQSWRAALHWLSLVMPILDDEADEVSPVPILLSLDLAPAGDLASGEIPGPEALDAGIVIAVSTMARSATITADRTWQLGARRIDNRSEIALAAALIEAASAILGKPTDRAAALGLVQAAVPSPDIRWRHAYYPDRIADVLRLHDNLTQTFSAASSSAVSLVKHGHALAPDRPPGTTLEGKAACMALLAELHAASLDRLLVGVAAYDRLALVGRSLGMMQAALAQEQHWANTARALRGIHGEAMDIAVSMDHRNRVNAVLRAASILAEVAASHSATSAGLSPGDMDYDELSAFALHHFGYCELVAAMAGDRLEAKLVVSPTGDLLYDHSFGQEALAPGAAALHAETRARHVADYGKRPGGDRTKGAEGTVRADLGEDLREALGAEFGVDADLFFALASALCDLAIEDGKDVLVLTRSDLLRRLQSLGFAQDAPLGALLGRLILPSREGWRDAPAGAHHNDFDLGRFDRPLSLIGRPLVALNADVDPLLAVGPAVVERTILHNLSGALDGSLQDRFWTSRAMQSHVGRAANRAGMAFNEAVAADIRAMGLEATASVAPWACLNHKATPALKLLGDVDVLVIAEDRRHVWVIEAKDIKLCRTLGETARRLSDYRGLLRRDGKPDKLLRHLDRVAYIRKHAADLATRLKLPGIPEVHGLVVVNMPQPMVFVAVCPSHDARFVRCLDLSGVDWTKAPRPPR